MVSFDLATSGSPTDAAPQTAVPTGTPLPTPAPSQTGIPSPTQAPTPTHTPVPVPTSTPTRTASPTPCLPDATFIEDVTVPDDAAFVPGDAFDKTWRIHSSGCAAWPAGTRWVFVDGDQLGAPAAVAVPDTPVGGTALIVVPLVAPTHPGTYRSTWQMQTADGERFGDRVYVQIVVLQPTPPPTHEPSPPKPTPIVTPEPPPP